MKLFVSLIWLLLITNPYILIALLCKYLIVSVMQILASSEIESIICVIWEIKVEYKFAIVLSKSV